MIRRVAAVLCLLLPLAAAAAEHAHAPAPDAGPPPLFDDLGTWSHPVTTSDPEAQKYFDQGLRLVYAFNHDEAIRAFREAARRDPDCAMAWWGIALASGPNYNLPIDSERDRTARDAIAKAKAAAPKATPQERDYIAALEARYAKPSGDDRKALDRAYADAMRGVAKKYPDDPDAAVIFAESMMVLRPWDLWKKDGSPQPGTEELVAVLEGVLAKTPQHPGANHYYIHALEASPHPERAIAAADRTGGLMPGAGHLVHMPSHVWMRVGRYADAAESNRKAIAADTKYMAAAKPAGVYPMMYVPHNVHFLWSAATMEGRRAEALDAAQKVAASVPPPALREMPMLELFAPTPWFAHARFGEWDAVLAAPPPPADLLFTKGMWHHARGRALVHTGKLDEAQAELEQVANIALAMPPDRIIGDNQPAQWHLQLATAMLAGELAAKRGQTEKALRLLGEAVVIEDKLPYTEPPAWYQPTRLVLGGVLLDAGRPAEAELIYREDLVHHPANGWALAGLADALRAQQKDAADVAKQFDAAWARADVKQPPR